MDHNQIMQNLFKGGILLMERRSQPCFLGSFSRLSQPQRNSLSHRIMEFATALAPYDTLEFNYGDHQFILYRLPHNIFVATLYSPKLEPHTLETLLPYLRQNIGP